MGDIVFIGMETSGELRRRFCAAGLTCISCDNLPAEDGGLIGTHIVGDVFETLDRLRAAGQWPRLAIFHPDCTYHTLAAAWAFADPDFTRYPGVGYHQKVKPDTIVGLARRREREQSESDVERIAALPIEFKIIENPKGTIPTRTSLGSPQQIVQPYQFGDDASKATCLWLFGLGPLLLDPLLRFSGRLVEWPKGSGKMVERWSNQTDSGQNRETPSENRWIERSRTYGGIAQGVVDHCVKYLRPSHRLRVDTALQIWMTAA